MKRLFFLLGGVVAVLYGVWPLLGADLAAVHSVYLLPMSRGMDQYLANRLTTEHVFQVVTDPKVADAILTDRIGEAFEEKLADILPSADGKPAAADKDEEQSPAALLTETSNKLANPLTSSTFGRARGMVFLVDPKSHQVVWSAYQPPKDTSSAQLEHAASEIISRLKRELKKQ